MPHHLTKFNIKGDARGSLIACEQSHNVPFDIRRVYYIFDTDPTAIRGKHAHKQLEQILICISGSCQVLVEENHQKKTYNLNSPTQGLYIGGLVWREMFNFTPGSVLVVLASQYYNEADYIRNYHEFLMLSQKT